MAKRVFRAAEGGIASTTDPDNGELNDVVSGVGSGGSGGTTDPSTLTSGNGDVGNGTIDGTEGTGKQRRKRAPNKTKKAPLDLTTVQNSLVILHFGLAGAFNAPELALTSDQAQAYAMAASDVLQYYDTGATAKTIAWVNLLSAMGGIYYTKFAQINQRKAAERAAKVRELNSGTVPRSAMGVV